MLKKIPSLKVKQLIRKLESAGCSFYREGRGDHSLYMRYVGEQKRVVPIDMRAKELSPPYVVRILRQFGFTDDEINALF